MMTFDLSGQGELEFIQLWLANNAILATTRLSINQSIWGYANLMLNQRGLNPSPGLLEAYPYSLKFITLAVHPSLMIYVLLLTCYWSKVICRHAPFLPILFLHHSQSKHHSSQFRRLLPKYTSNLVTQFSASMPFHICILNKVMSHWWPGPLFCPFCACTACSL